MLTGFFPLSTSTGGLSMMAWTSTRFWLAWLFLICVGIAFCTRQASQVYKQRNAAKEEEGRKPQRDDGGEETAAKTEKGKAVAMKMFNRDAVLRPQQPNDIECSPITTRQRHQDKRNQSRYNSNSDNNHTNDVKLEKDDKARRVRWVENVCGFIKRPLVDYIYEQAMAARLQKRQELYVANNTQLAPPPAGTTGPPLRPSSSSGHSKQPTLSLRKRQPKTITGAVSQTKDSVTAKRSCSYDLLNLKDQLAKILNEAIKSANDDRMGELIKQRHRHGDNPSSCSCY